MKSTLARNTGAGAMVLAMLAGCGQPGPLYMPKPPAKPQPVTAPVPTPPPSVPQL